MAKTTERVHPAAALLPMMSEGELAELAHDIEVRGQILPIIRHEGVILDGRNRLAACERAGREPWFEEWDGRGVTPTGFAVSANLPRRHLNETQRAVIGAQALPLFEAEARARQGKRQKTEPAATSVPRGTEVPAEATSRAREEAPDKKKPKRAAEAAAKAVGSSARSIARAKTVLERKPELLEQLRDAKLSLKQAEKSIKKEEQLKSVLAYRPPVGKYAVIVADPSWKFDDELDGSDQARGGVGYPPQTEEEICAMQVGQKHAAPDCALWLWVTNTHLINGAAARVLDAWGFIGKALYTWRKVDKNGNDRLGTGRYGRNVTEHVILAVRGKPVVDAGSQPNIFDAPRTSRHSEKPARLFEIAEKVTPCAPEARLELFAVDPERKGWVTSGSEQQAKARAERPTKKRKLLIVDRTEAET